MFRVATTLTSFFSHFIMITLLILSHHAAFADAKLEAKIQELEGKVSALEKLISKKDMSCQLSYKHHAYRLNNCDRGTFVRSVVVLNSSAVQLECGYYQLACE